MSWPTLERRQITQVVRGISDETENCCCEQRVAPREHPIAERYRKEDQSDGVDEVESRGRPQVWLLRHQVPDSFAVEGFGDNAKPYQVNDQQHKQCAHVSGGVFNHLKSLAFRVGSAL